MTTNTRHGLDLLTNAERCGWPALRDFTSSLRTPDEGQHAWLQFVGAASESEVRHAARLLGEHSDRLRRDAADEERAESARHRAAVAAGEEAPTEADLAVGNQARIEAEAQRQDFVARRPERVDHVARRRAGEETDVAVLEQHVPPSAAVAFQDLARQVGAGSVGQQLPHDDPWGRGTRLW